MKPFLNGLITGMIFQLAVGPAFFFVVNTALQGTSLNGLLAAAGVTVADYVFILLGIFGVGKMLEKKKTKKMLGILGAVVLIIFGIFVLISTGNKELIAEQSTSNSLLSSFSSAFLLTIFSPLTIVFWTGLFSAKVVEYNYTRKELVSFGLACGLATLLFLGTASLVLSLTRTIIPDGLILMLNIIVGIILVSYGGMRLGSSLKV